MGYEVIDLGPEINNYSDFVLLVPDHLQAQILLEYSEFMRGGSRIVYAHGYALTRHKLAEQHPLLNHLLLAPKAIASAIIETGLGKNQFRSVIGLEFSKSIEFDFDFLESLARDLKCQFPLIKSSAKEEMTADLFSEQSLLCSLIPYGALKSFNLLVEKGISPEIAYIECWSEVKLIADAMMAKGPAGFFSLISPNALVGGEKAKQLFFDKGFDQKLEKLYQDIDSGRFFKEIENIDFDQRRSEVLSEWQKEAINALHNKMTARKDA